jgi:excisionase family DNA binding protein
MELPATPCKRAFTLAEFCSAYGIGRTTAYGEINAGRLTAIKCGRRTLITTDAAEAWLHALEPALASRADAAAPNSSM